MIKREDIEKQVLSLLAEKIKQHGFTPGAIYFKGRVHFGEFVMKKDEVSYKYRVEFHLPDWLWYAVFLDIQYQPVHDLMKKIDAAYAKNTGVAFAVKIFDYLHHPNRTGIFEQNSLHNEYLTQPYGEAQVAADVEQLYRKYFMVVVNDIIPKTDSLAKADILVNTLPGITDSRQPMPWSIFSPFAITQCVTSIILARLSNRKEYAQLRQRYLDYIAGDEPGKNSFIDMLRKTIKYLDENYKDAYV